MDERAEKHAVPGSSGVTVYYVDGYHGGIAGHMPLGSLRDVLREMNEKPWWYVTFEIEPFSWDEIRRRDPQAYAELQVLLQESGPNARMELVSGAYAQPFCWAFNGESNIRHLLIGRAELRRHFPEAVVDTYAVQEPCWTSSLPQLLRSLGYVRASLKNPSTAWGGYTAGFDADVVDWVGPDGTAIPTVPRYACEDLSEVWRTESVAPSAAFAAKCAERGVSFPVGMCFQDMGWPAHPAVDADGTYVSPSNESLDDVRWPDEEPSFVRYTTWRQFFERFAPVPERAWRFSQEDIHVALPWGSSELQRLARQVRSAENRVLVAEKTAALAWIFAGQSWPGERLDAAWRQLLLAQHHDSWIVFFGREGRDRWAWKVGAQTWAAEQVCDEVIARSLEALDSTEPVSTDALEGVGIRVVNTLGHTRESLVEVPLAVPPDVGAISVHDGAGDAAPAQLVTSRTYPDGAPNAGSLLFRAKVPALGFTSYRMRFDEAGGSLTNATPPGDVAVARVDADGSVHIETDLYRIKLDPTKGGAVTSLYDKRVSREIVDPTVSSGFCAYRGYFPDLDGWASSADEVAEVTILESGPVRVRAEVKGKVASSPFTSHLTVTQGEPRIDVHVVFDFPPGTRIGEPWDGSPTRLSRRRPCYDDRYKLQALFPAALDTPVVYKNAAYDVCRSALEDTYFNSWDTIKHNVILEWVDLYDEDVDVGLALLSDHTTSYALGPDDPLGLVLGFSGPGTWGYDYPIVGKLEARYALLPHPGDWQHAAVWQANRAWVEPLLSQVLVGDAGTATQRSLATLSDDGVEVAAVTVEDDRLLMRLFNAAATPTNVSVTFGVETTSATLIELDGREIEDLPVHRDSDDRPVVHCPMRPFGIVTLRVETASEEISGHSAASARSAS